MFSHIGGVSRTFARVECKEPDLGMEYLQATMNLVAKCNAANESVRRHNQEVEACNREVFLRNGMDPEADDDDQESFKILYQDACNGGGHELACLAEAFLSGEYGAVEDKPKAVRLFKKAVQKGCVDAEARLAYCYLNGEGVREDDEEGVRWLETAARHGDADSRELLAAIRAEEEKRREEAEKRREAREWCERVEKERRKDVEDHIADHGMDPNAREMAKSLFMATIAMAEHDVDSQRKLGDWFFEGKMGAVKDLTRSFNWYLKAAKQDDAEAEYHVGYAYYFGKGVEENEPEAFKWFKKAAEKGSADGMCRLGECYFNGRGTSKDHNLGFEWYKKSAAQGCGLAQVNVGKMYYKGNDVVQKNLGEAFKWFELAAEKRADAKSYLGECLENGYGVSVDEERAGRLYKESADADDPNGLYNYARCLEDGLCGVEASLSKALTLYKKAEKKGFVEAAYHIGDFYNNGWSVDEDKNVAFEWYLKAAEKGVPAAQDWVGAFYRDGRGDVEKNCAKGLEWFLKAAAQGYAQAQYNAANCYLNGEGCEEDDCEALKWFLKSAEQGKTSAQNMVGRCFEKGWGCEKDAAKAVEWYCKAVEKGDLAAMNNLAFCYENAVGVNKDLDKAMEWFRKAAEDGYRRSMYHLGRLYENGIGVDVDKAKAKEWYGKGAEKGDSDSKTALERLGRNGN